MGEGKSGIKAGIVNTKVARRANTPPLAFYELPPFDSATVRVFPSNFGIFAGGDMCHGRYHTELWDSRSPRKL